MKIELILIISRIIAIFWAISFLWNNGYEGLKNNLGKTVLAIMLVISSIIN